MVFHSFGHLSEIKSSIEFAEDALKQQGQAIAKGFKTSMTPLGYFSNLKYTLKENRWQRYGNQYSPI